MSPTISALSLISPSANSDPRPNLITSTSWSMSLGTESQVVVEIYPKEMGHLFKTLDALCFNRRFTMPSSAVVMQVACVVSILRYTITVHKSVIKTYC